MPFAKRWIARHTAFGAMKKSNRVTTFLMLFLGLAPCLGAQLSGLAQEEMRTGIAAAKRGDFALAIQHLEVARRIAPDAADVYFNIGLAESNIPGRELRAVVWFGAFLAADPSTPKAAAIKEKISELNVQGLTRFLKITAGIADQTTNQRVKDIYLAMIADLWARAGNYSMAFQTTNSIQEYYWKGDGLSKIAGAQARAGDIAAALQTTSLIRNVDGRSSAVLNISYALLRAGDLRGARQTAEGIQDPNDRITAKIGIAQAQCEAGDSAGALETLAEALRLTDDLDLRSKNVRRGSIAIGQAAAGNFAAALRTANNIPDAFSVGLSKVYIAESQAKSGDLGAARKTLAEALEAADKVQESKYLLVQAYNETEARISAGTAGAAGQPIVDRPPSVSTRDWVSKNDSLLNQPLFLDLAAHLKTVSIGDPSQIMESLVETAKKMIEVYEITGRMLKQQNADLSRGRRD